MVDLVIRKRGGWDDGGMDRVGWGVGMGIDVDMMIIMKRYLLMIVGCVRYILIYVTKGLERGVFLAQIYR